MSAHDEIAADVLLSGGGVWVVTGTMGDYSDREWWIEAVAVSKDAADTIVAACEQWARMEQEHRDADGYDYSTLHAPPVSREFTTPGCYIQSPSWAAEHLPDLSKIPGILIPGGAE